MPRRRLSSLPTTATAANSKHTIHNSGLLIRPISVRKPVKAKNNGRKKTKEMSSYSLKD